MKYLRFFLVLICAAIGLLSAWAWVHQVQPAQAEADETIRYVGAGDCGGHTPCYHQIQEAVNAAAEGDEIWIAGGTYTEMNQFNGTPQVVFISKTLTLRGGYSPDYSVRDRTLYTTTIDAQNAGRPMVIKGVIEVTLEGLRLVNGNGTSLGSQGYNLPEGGCAPYPGWMKAGKGGGLCIESGSTDPSQLASVIISDTVILDNKATTKTNEYGIGGGIYAGFAHLVIVNSLIDHNLGNPSWWAFGVGINIYKSTLDIQDSIIEDGYGSTVVEGGGINSAHSHLNVERVIIRNNKGEGVFTCFDNKYIVQIRDSKLVDNFSSGVEWGGGNACNGTLYLERNLIAGNNHGGIFVGSNGRGRIENNVIIKNVGKDSYGDPGHGAGVYLQTYVTTAGQELIFNHNTIAHNTGLSGVYVGSGNSIWNNNIIADHAIGVVRGSTGGGASLTLNNTLFSGNVLDTQGSSITQNGTVIGEAAFLDDGYHISGMSDAVERGLAGLSYMDFDGESRPRPVGTLPDIGADEIGVKILVPFQKIALPVQITWNETANPYYVTYEQPYLIRFANIGNSAMETLVITDDLPAMLNPEYTWFYPEMSLSRPTHQQVTWSAKGSVPAGSFGYITLLSRYDTPEPGQVVVNQATLFARTSAGDVVTNVQVVTSTTPLIPPLITFPGPGEICPTPDDRLNVKGLALPGALLAIYFDDQLVYTGTVPANGQFDVNIAAELDDSGKNLEAAVCVPGNQCSIKSEPIAVKRANSFFCPQRSTWTAPTGWITYTFRDSSGSYSTHDWFIPGYYGFYSTTLVLYACNCPEWSGFTGMPSHLWVEADNKIYQPDVKSPPWYTFKIGSAHSVIFWAQCDENAVSSRGWVLIDPDGYVFDVTKGLGLTVGPSDTVTVTNTIQGVTVTAYVSMPEMGGWMPWPAHLYNQQKNPQVTGPDGYYAFFTPPGDYFIKAEGPGGFQEWRSPVVTVISELVHVNIPYTPIFEGQQALVELTPDGPVPAEVIVSPGSRVTWVFNPPATLSVEKLRQMVVNPLVQVRTSGVQDPLTSVLGFDSGKLRPGDTYSRGFGVVGEYIYTDGLGHTGKVIVKYQVYLPLVVR